MSWRDALKKPGTQPTAPKPKFETRDDDWDTDITFENKVTEKSQRYGATSVPGSGRVDHVDLKTIRDKVKVADDITKDTYKDKNPNRGYGGKFGTEQVMDKSAADFSYTAEIKKHSSQTDSKKGFGGEFGIDERAKDKSAVGFEYKAAVEKHSSQTDSKKGFGGEFGIDERAKDKSAVGFEYKATVEKHSSQKDYSAGFGGKYGVQKGDTSSASVTPAVPADPKPVAEEKVIEKPVTPLTPTSAKANVGNIRSKFENLKKEKEAEAAQRVAEERKKRTAADQNLQASQQTIDNKREQEQVEQNVASEEPPLISPSTQVSQTEESSSNVYENIDNKAEQLTPTTTTEQQQENKDKIVSGVNIRSLLRQRKVSSTSSHKSNDDDEWAVDADENN